MPLEGSTGGLEMFRGTHRKREKRIFIADLKLSGLRIGCCKDLMQRYFWECVINALMYCQLKILSVFLSRKSNAIEDVL